MDPTRAKFEAPPLIPKKVNDYVMKVGFSESDIAKELREATGRHPRAIMMGDPVEAAMFKVLLPAIGAKKVVEVGVFTGYTTLIMAEAIGPEGTIAALDVNDEFASIGREYWNKAGVEDRIDLKIAPALDSLQALIEAGEEGTFDFAFIDADKVNYPSYYEKLLVLLRKDGLIAIDNVLWHGQVVDPSANDADTNALREISRIVHADDRVEHALIPFADGVTLVRKK